MRIFLALVLAAFIAFASPPVSAQAPDESALRSAITRQLDALNRSDQDQAFAIASPMIQKMFQDAPTFMRMVQAGYPQIFRSRTHRFLKLDTSDGRLIQRVLIESAAGTVVARYEMVEIDGVWRINGCAVEAGQET